MDGVRCFPVVIVDRNYGGFAYITARRDDGIDGIVRSRVSLLVEVGVWCGEYAPQDKYLAFLKRAPDDAILSPEPRWKQGEDIIHEHWHWPRVYNRGWGRSVEDRYWEELFCEGDWDRLLAIIHRETVKFTEERELDGH